LIQGDHTHKNVLYGLAGALDWLDDDRLDSLDHFARRVDVLAFTNTEDGNDVLCEDEPVQTSSVSKIRLVSIGRVRGKFCCRICERSDRRSSSTRRSAAMSLSVNLDLSSLAECFLLCNTIAGLVSSFPFHKMVKEDLVTVANSCSHLPLMPVNLQSAPAGLFSHPMSTSSESGRHRKSDKPI
jgi:hypothetical protein